MAQYMFLLFDDEKWYDELTPESWETAMKLHGEFATAVEAAGARILEGRALERSSTATTITKDWSDPSAKPVATDGPFIETKEALGGFYLVEARDLDQALELANICPSGHVEVRPVMDTSGDAPS
ncbi:MAG TPA: YciI family protein [Nocardioidaceae bacterium]